MEAFSLLKYLRVGGRPEPDTIVTHAAVDSGSDNDDGPFFDLELAVPDSDEAEDRDASREDNVSTCAEDGDGADTDAGGTDGERREYNFALSSSGSSSSSDDEDDNDDRTDQNLSLSPPDDLFFKGRLVPVEPSSLARISEPNSKFSVSLLKSATKFRVLMMGFKKSRQSTESTKTESETELNKTEQAPKPPGAAEPESKEKRFFTVKFKFEEVPIMSLFTKDHSNSRSAASSAAEATSEKQSITGSSEPAASDEKRLSKDTMQKYLRKVKPLYVRVSRRYGEKMGFSGQLSLVSGSAEPPSKAAPENPKSVKQRNLTAGLRVVSKHLGKSRTTETVAPERPAVPRRRDDSLLQQQDGIQSAILHCKRSFNASRDPSSSLASKCASDSETGGEKTKKPLNEDGA